MVEAPEGRLARARERSVFIATPIARQPAFQFTMALAATFSLLLRLGIRGYFQSVRGSSNLPRARNELVAQFLCSGYTDLLFVDDDMGWEPDAVVRLLASEQRVIGGVGAKKRLLADDNPAKWCVRIEPERPFIQDAFGAIQVDGVGTGFLKIERGVFADLADAHSEWKRPGLPEFTPEQAANYYRFFQFSDDGTHEWGEDFHFCRAWAALGGTIWIDPAIRLVHVGEMEFSGDIGAIFGREEQP